MRIGVSDAEFVELTLVGRSNPDSLDFWDGNWLRAEVQVASHRLRGTARTRVRVDELNTLADQLTELHRTSSGHVEFWPSEPNLKLTFDVYRRGGLTVYAELQPDLADAALLVFELRLDQDFLVGIIAQLRAHLQVYPQVGQP